MHLRLLILPTCVGFRYGPPGHVLRRFSRRRILLPSLARRPAPPRLASERISPLLNGSASGRGSFTPRHVRFASRLRSPEGWQILHCLTIGYGPRPRLRLRLSRGGLPLPSAPSAFGGRGLHPPFRYLCLHSLFRFLQKPSRVFLHGLAERSPTSRSLRNESAVSAPRLAPLHCLRGGARPVSCYALFQGMAASEPTSWLSSHPHFI